jgi:hypothetical protein
MAVRELRAALGEVERDLFSSVREPWASEMSTRSGSSETDVKELSVMPAGWPWCSVVTTQTPVAKAPTTSRNSRSTLDIVVEHERSRAPAGGGRRRGDRQSERS